MDCPTGTSLSFVFGLLHELAFKILFLWPQRNGSLCAAALLVAVGRWARGGGRWGDAQRRIKGVERCAAAARCPGLMQSDHRPPLRSALCLSAGWSTALCSPLHCSMVRGFGCDATRHGALCVVWCSAVCSSSVSLCVRACMWMEWSGVEQGAAVGASDQPPSTGPLLSHPLIHWTTRLPINMRDTQTATTATTAGQSRTYRRGDTPS